MSQSSLSSLSFYDVMFCIFLLHICFLVVVVVFFFADLFVLFVHTAFPACLNTQYLLFCTFTLNIVGLCFVTCFFFAHAFVIPHFLVLVVVCTSFMFVFCSLFFFLFPFVFNFFYLLITFSCCRHRFCLVWFVYLGACFVLLAYFDCLFVLGCFD